MAQPGNHQPGVTVAAVSNVSANTGAVCHALGLGFPMGQYTTLVAASGDCEEGCLRLQIIGEVEQCIEMQFSLQVRADELCKV